MRAYYELANSGARLALHKIKRPKALAGRNYFEKRGTCFHLGFVAAQAARSVCALRGLGVQGIDCRGVLAHRLVGVSAGRTERPQRGDSSWFADISVSGLAGARNDCGPLLGAPPCAQH